MPPIFIAFFIPYLALTLWVYFDATERGKPAIPWALSVFFLGWFVFVPLILYVIFRDTGHRWEMSPGAGRRQYLYTVAFSGLLTLLIGLTLIITSSIIRALTDDAERGGFSASDYRQALAAGLSGVIVGGLFWGTHWFRGKNLLRHASTDAEFRSTFLVHRSYVYAVFGISGLTVFVSGLWFLGGGLADLLQVEDVELKAWLPTLGPLSVAIATAALHFGLHFNSEQFRNHQSRYDTIPEPVLIASPQKPGPMTSAIPSSPEQSSAQPRDGQFCTNCGTRAKPEDAFCFSCGNALRTT